MSGHRLPAYVQFLFLNFIESETENWRVAYDYAKIFQHQRFRQHHRFVARLDTSSGNAVASRFSRVASREPWDPSLGM